MCYKADVVEDGVGRRLPERTGRHICASCLREISLEEYLSGDHYCRECAERAETYPNASTPGQGVVQDRKDGED